MRKSFDYDMDQAKFQMEAIEEENKRCLDVLLKRYKALGSGGVFEPLSAQSSGRALQSTANNTATTTPNAKS